MAVPKRKWSHQRSAKNRTNYKTEPYNVSRCTHCNQPKIAHRVCANCGFYGGEEIVQPEE
ncbi:MAG: 50S ribosomal protein L32 [Fibrobacterota bacterium]